MKISYDLNIDNVAAYYQFYLDNSPIAASKRSQNIMLITAVYLIFIVVLVFILHNYKLAVFCLAAYFFSVVWYIRFGRKVKIKSLEKVYSQGNLKDTLGKYSLEIYKNAMKVNSPTVESTVNLSEIESIVDTGNYVFIIMGPMAAYIIPKQNVSSGDVNAFIESLRKIRNYEI